jgi:hypothetical protein
MVYQFAFIFEWLLANTRKLLPDNFDPVDDCKQEQDFS